jgi:drug/metabolite transporter (DMT)-like permease
MFKSKSDLEQLLLPPQQQPSSDNRLLAIVCINVFSVTYSLSNALFKMTTQYGVTPWEFLLWRGCVMGACSLFPLAYLRKNPFKTLVEVGSKTTWYVMGRSFIGQTTFLLFTVSLVFVPLSIGMMLY